MLAPSSVFWRLATGRRRRWQLSLLLSDGGLLTAPVAIGALVVTQLDAAVPPDVARLPTAMTGNGGTRRLACHLL